MTTLPDRTALGSPRKRPAPRIRTERLVLCAPRLEDAKTIATLLNDRRIAENTLRIPYPYGIADAQAFIAGANVNSSETVFLITKRDATVLGACGLAERPAAPPEIGYWLAVPFWGKGYATEAARAMIDYAFDHLGYEVLHAVRLPVDGGRPLSHPIARLVRAPRPFPARARGLGQSPCREA